MSELIVLQKSKKLCDDVFLITDKSPKKFRQTTTIRMQDLALATVEAVYRANDTFVAGENPSAAGGRRLSYQRDALSHLKVLDYLTQFAREQQAILPRQHQQLSKSISDCQHLVAAWLKSEQRRQQKRQ